MRDFHGAFDQLDVIVGSNLAESMEKLRRPGVIISPLGPSLYLAGFPYAATWNSVACGVNVIRTAAYVPHQNMTIDQLAFHLIGLGAAGSVARIGLYDSDPVSLRPRNLLFDSGSLATDAGAGVRTAAVSPPIVLKRGTVYWLAILTGVAAPSLATSTTVPVPILGSAAGDLTATQFAWKLNFAFGPFPVLWPGGEQIMSFNTDNLIALAVRVTSIG